MQTTFCLSASALGTIFLMALALMIASSGFNYESQKNASQMVPLPMITMAIEQGPWPKCVGMSGEDCMTYIQSSARDVDIQIVPEGSMVTEDFRSDRVRVWVDSDGLVFAVPSRG